MISGMHRRSLLRHAGLLAAAPWTMLPAAPRSLAQDALPRTNLVVEARVASTSQQRDAAAQGGVVVGTVDGARAGAAVVAGAGTHRRGDEQLQRVLVLNGARATLRLARLAPLRSAEWVWTGRGAGVAQQVLWVDTGRGFEVRPSWPGGDAQVQLDLAVEATASLAADAPRTLVQTQILVALDEWTPVARVGSSAGSRGVASTGGTVLSTRTLEREVVVEVRVGLPP
jgi:hypothetical protein